MALNNQNILKKVKSEISKTDKSLEELRERRTKLTAEIDDQINILQKKAKDLQALKKQTETDIKREKEKEERLAILLGKKVADETETVEEVEEEPEQEPEFTEPEDTTAEAEVSEADAVSEVEEEISEEVEEPQEVKVESSGWFNRH